MEFLGFCIFASVVWYCDHQQFLAGYDAWFFKAKTEDEKQIRKNLIEKSK